MTSLPIRTGLAFSVSVAVAVKTGVVRVVDVEGGRNDDDLLGFLAGRPMWVLLWRTVSRFMRG